ncbi:MAG TPA: hypothetical protein VIK33_15265, partial [Anaerolineae bacterium]
LDPIIDRLLQQDPAKRPQTADVVLNMLNESLKPSTWSAKESAYIAMGKFHNRLRSVFPGKQGLIRVTDKDKIDYLLAALSSNLSEYGFEGALWWTRGYSDNHIRRMYKLDEGLWLINEFECTIEEAWVNRVYSSLHNEYVLLQLAPMPPFEIYDRDEYDGEYDNAAWFTDRYITSDEYNDGVDELDAHVVELDGVAEPRVRNMKRQFMFLVVFGHHVQGYHETVEQVYRALIEHDRVSPGILRPLERLMHHPIFQE